MSLTRFEALQLAAQLVQPNQSPICVSKNYLNWRA